MANHNTDLQPWGGQIPIAYHKVLSHCSKKPKVPFQGAPPRLICVMISWTMVMFNNTKEIFLVEGKFDHFFGQK